MDRLSLFKLLAEPSRYSIYQQLARSDEPLSTTEIARRLDVHPNTARLHLEKMREAGLVVAAAARQGSVGRPVHRWAAVPQSAALGLEPAGFRLLARLLADLAADNPPDPATVAAIGRRQGQERPVSRPAYPGPPRAACVRAVMDDLTDLGFDPAVEFADAEAGATIWFTHCPFRELAALYPDLVCQLHRGLTEGILDEAVAANPGVTGRVESFGSLVDADPCRVELSLST